MTEEHQSILCPYCGHGQTALDRCQECGGLFEPLSRRATQIAMGPWFVRDKARPFRPGCSYEVLRRQVELGKVRPHTIIRGPTTRQFWMVARHVPGVAHLLGFCHECGANVQPTAERCPECSAAFGVAQDRNSLGLLFPTAKDAAVAQEALDREVAAAAARAAEHDRGAPPPGASAARPPRPASAGVVLPGTDLLDEVIGKPRRRGAGSPWTGGMPGAGTEVPDPLPANQDDAAVPVVRAQGIHGRGSGGSGGSRRRGADTAAPEVLDFGPSEESRGQDRTAVVRAPRTAYQRRQKLLISVLIGAVVALLALLITVVALWHEGRQPEPDVRKLTARDNADAVPTPTTTAPGVAQTTVPGRTPTVAPEAAGAGAAPANTADNGLAPGMVPAPTTMPTDLPLVPPPQPPAPAPAPDAGSKRNQARSDSGRPGGGHGPIPMPVMRHAASTRPATLPPAATRPAPAPGAAAPTSLFAPTNGPASSSATARMAQARKLETAGKYADALAILNSLAKLPPDQRPAGLEEAIKRVGQLAAHQFFEGDQ